MYGLLWMLWHIFSAIKGSSPSIITWDAFCLDIVIFLLVTLSLNIRLNICVASSQERRETSFSDILNNYIASTARTLSVWDGSKIMTFNLDWHSLNWVAGFAGLTWHLIHLLFLVFLNAELMPETHPTYT